MNTIPQDDATVRHFRERFPTTDDFVNWLLAQPPQPSTGKADFFARVIRQRQERLTQEQNSENPSESEAL